MALSAQEIRAIPELTLAQLEKDESASVFVFNLSGTPTSGNPRGIINLSINDGVGNTIPVRIGITWVPIDLTTQVTKSALLHSPPFRKLASSGAIKLINERDALAIISTPEGRKETMRVHSSERYIGDLNDVSIPNLNDVISTDEVNAIALSVVHRDDIDEEACISILEGHEITMVQKDFEFIAKNSKFAGVKDWALQRID